jgi:hypothetical protein
MRPSSVESRFPPGWDEERIRGVLEYYERQTDEEAAAEDEAAFESEIDPHEPRRGDSV